MLNKQLKQLQLPLPIAIIGAGITGKSCFDLLQSAGISSVVFDERDSLPQHFSGLDKHVKLGEISAEHLTHFGTILLSPGIDTRRDCFKTVENKILTDIELFARLTKKTIIGVTGSNGKSTVVSLIKTITAAARKNFILCGNIGKPVLSALLENDTACDGYIVELSSYHLERAASLSPFIGIWLNISPDHLDRYDNFEHYTKTKAKLFEQSLSIIANADDQLVNAYAQKHKNCIYFSQQNSNTDYYFSNGMIYRKGKALFSLEDYPQVGDHHADNLMAAFATARKLGIEDQITFSACKTFNPLPCRTVVVAKHKGITFINDSKGTNIGATVAALKGIHRPIILIAGGQGKNQNFNELALVAKERVKIAFLFGEDAACIQKSLSPFLTCQRVDNLDKAFNAAVEIAEAGDVVILSPACASFDMFENYLKRGEYFEELVEEWINAE